jgi:hypothetical protein
MRLAPIWFCAEEQLQQLRRRGACVTPLAIVMARWLLRRWSSSAGPCEPAARFTRKRQRPEFAGRRGGVSNGGATRPQVCGISRRAATAALVRRSAHLAAATMDAAEFHRTERPGEAAESPVQARGSNSVGGAGVAARSVPNQRSALTRILQARASSFRRIAELRATGSDRPSAADAARRGIRDG